MRYYVQIASYLLPTVADRPLTYRPYPQGLKQRPDRYHQRVKHAVPPGVRVETFQGIEKHYESRFIGGSLVTLLYLVQIHVASIDPGCHASRHRTILMSPSLISIRWRA